MTLLKLNKETLRNLNEAEAEHVNGGFNPDTSAFCSRVVCHTYDCPRTHLC